MHPQKIGLYGGTFDPIHFGHLSLAIELMEKQHLDQVWFIAASLNPHKIQDKPIASIEHRLNMVRLAIKEISEFFLIELESQKAVPSYTIDIVKEILSLESKKPIPAQFYLILGEDSIPGFLRWKNPEEIVKLTKLLIGSRTGVWKTAETHHDNPITQAIQNGMTKTRIMDISSTELRGRLPKNLYCGHLIPAKVIDYIIKNRLYC